MGGCHTAVTGEPLPDQGLAGGGVNEQEGSLPEKGGKLVERAHQQTLLHKAVQVGEKSLVWKKNHPLDLAANTLSSTHIHPLPSYPLNPD